MIQVTKISYFTGALNFSLRSYIDTSYFKNQITERMKVSNKKQNYAT